ncbi:hypothetical protein GCM10009641_69880 [Mycobacterium cookii]|uniref:Uncharacterized protein n=1 Tax=Nocardioides furvisabuli TaxID=375542 RepID=A0ABN2WSB5_9ACTN|nr:hypothetical protein [Nocardioides furvisabuli]
MSTDPLTPLTRALFNRPTPDDEIEAPQAVDDPEQIMRHFVARLFAPDND